MPSQTRIGRRALLRRCARAVVMLGVLRPLGGSTTAVAGDADWSTVLDFGGPLDRWEVRYVRRPAFVAAENKGSAGVTTRGIEDDDGVLCALSPPFRIDGTRLRAEVRGSAPETALDPLDCMIGLMVGGALVRSRAASATGGIDWDVAELAGNTARVVLFDAAPRRSGTYLTALGTLDVLKGGTVASKRARSARVDDAPSTGFIHPDYIDIEREIKRYMRQYGLPSGAIALSRNGLTLIDRAFGYFDAACTRPLTTDAVFRLGSVEKMVVRSAARLLVDRATRIPVVDETLTLDTRVFDVLRRADVVGKSMSIRDRRVLDVTLGQLIDHTSGIAVVYHVVPEIRAALKLRGMPTQTDFLEYYASRLLESEPGTVEKYNNSASTVLWNFVHWVTGDGLDFVRRAMFDPSLWPEVVLSRSRPEDRLKNEVWYSTAERAKSIFPDDRERTVSVVDGGRDYFDHTIATSARALLAYGATWELGRSRRLVSSTGRLDSGIQNGLYQYNGSWNGTTCTVFQQRWCLSACAVHFNARCEGSGPSQEDAAGVVLAVLKSRGW